jgi:hypothetical protein
MFVLAGPEMDVLPLCKSVRLKCSGLARIAMDTDAGHVDAGQSLDAAAQVLG